MEIPKKVNGKECVDNIINAMAAYNAATLALDRLNPEIKPWEAELASGLAIGLVLEARSLVELAHAFGINADISEKERLILVNGKVCKPSFKNK